MHDREVQAEIRTWVIGECFEGDRIWNGSNSDAPAAIVKTVHGYKTKRQFKGLGREQFYTFNMTDCTLEVAAQ